VSSLNTDQGGFYQDFALDLSAIKQLFRRLIR